MAVEREMHLFADGKWGRFRFAKAVVAQVDVGAIHTFAPAAGRLAERAVWCQALQRRHQPSTFEVVDEYFYCSRLCNHLLEVLGDEGAHGL